jgi:hypothetical protein
LIEMARSADIVGAKALIAQQFTRSVDLGYFLDGFMSSVTENFYTSKLTPNQAVEVYKAAVDVKSKLKYMSGIYAATYLFALLLRVFAYEGKQTSVIVKSEKLKEMFA